MLIQAVTIFPEMFDSITRYGVTGRANRQGIWQFEAVNPRKFADNRLGYIDDRPFGGGPGMIMMAPAASCGDRTRQSTIFPNRKSHLPQPPRKTADTPKSGKTGRTYASDSAVRTL